MKMKRKDFERMMKLDSKLRESWIEAIDRAETIGDMIKLGLLKRKRR